MDWDDFIEAAEAQHAFTPEQVEALRTIVDGAGQVPSNVDRGEDRNVEALWRFNLHHLLIEITPDGDISTTTLTTRGFSCTHTDDAVLEELADVVRSLAADNDGEEE